MIENNVQKIPNLQALLTKISEDIDNWELFSAFQRIRDTEQSQLYPDLNFREKLILFFFKVMCNYPNISPNNLDIHSDFSRMESFAKELNSSDDIADFYFYTTKMLIKLYNSQKLENGELELGLKYKDNLVTTLLVNSNFFTKKIIVIFYFSIANHYRLEKESDNALKFYDLALDLAQNIKVDALIYFVTRGKMMLFQGMGDSNSEEKIIRWLIDYYKQNSDEFFYGRCLILLATYLTYQGRNLKKAYGYTDVALNVSKKLTDISQRKNLAFYFIYNNRGIILCYMGKYLESITEYNKALPFAMSLNNDFNSPGISALIGNLGESYLALGDFEKSLEYQKNAMNYIIDLPKGSRTMDSVAERYYHLAKLLIHFNQISEAEECLNKIHEILSNPNIHFYQQIQAQSYIIQSLILIEEKTLVSSSKAQSLLKKIISFKIKNELSIDALIPLIDLTIQEYKLMGNPETFKKINEYTSIFKDIADKYISIPFKIQSLLIQGKLDLVSGNFNNFESNFTKALDLANEFELGYLKQEIDRSLSEFNNDIVKWKNLFSEKNSLIERIETVNLLEYMKSAKSLLE